MRKIHKIISWFILLGVSLAAWRFDAQMTSTTAQGLITFFSVVFGFYITSISILYNAAFTKALHKQVDKKQQKRGTHILKSYLLVSGYWAILSVTSIILFTTFATEETGGALHTKFVLLAVPFSDESLNLTPLLSSGLFGISALNIFYMLLLMRTIIYGMLEEAKK